jgi:hypothetical protein
MDTLTTNAPPPVVLVAEYPLRDPFGDADRYFQNFSLRFGDANHEYFSILGNELTKSRAGQKNLVLSYASNNIDAITGRMLYMYARGDKLEMLVDHIKIDLPYALELKSIHNNLRYGKTENSSGQGIDDRYHWDRTRFLTLVLLLAPESTIVDGWLSFYSGGESSYYVDVLLKGFLPTWSVIKNQKTLPKRGRGGERLEAMQELFRGLVPTTIHARSEGIAHYMGKWNRLMKPYGWKPKRVYCALNAEGMQVDRNCVSDTLFVDFAFEAALAVCAYDLDDTSFRDHPYYPRDLVDYYRAKIRHTRDAWRAQGVGAGIEIEPPPSPPKLDLAKSKSKGLVRWVELASDGDNDATDAVIEQVGKLRKVKEVSELSCALAENGAGLHADLKDDDTTIGQIDTLLQKRQLQFEAPVAGSNDQATGIRRCAAVLLALDKWLQDKPYRLLALDTQDDSWQAVLVAQAHAPEFEQLSAALGIGLVAPQEAFDV